MKLPIWFKLIRKLFKHEKDKIVSPLSNGFLVFLHDNDRTLLKNIFYLSNGKYEKAPNPIYLNYDGEIERNFYCTPWDTEGNEDLYYIKLHDKDGNFVRAYESWPCEEQS